MESLISYRKDYHLIFRNYYSMGLWGAGRQRIALPRINCVW